MYIGEGDGSVMRKHMTNFLEHIIDLEKLKDQSLKFLKIYPDDKALKLFLDQEEYLLSESIKDFENERR